MKYLHFVHRCSHSLCDIFQLARTLKFRGIIQAVLDRLDTYTINTPRIRILLLENTIAVFAIFIF